MAWAVSLAKKAARQLEELPATDWLRVQRAIDELAENPSRGSIASLQGPEWKGYFRKRVGDFRIIFSLDRSALLVTVYAVSRRSEKTYRR